MNEMAKRPWKAGVLLIAVFLAGALVGARSRGSGRRCRGAIPTGCSST